MHHILGSGKFCSSLLFICRYLVIYEITVYFVTTWIMFIEVHTLFCTDDTNAHLLVFLVIPVIPLAVSSVLFVLIGGGFECRLLVTIGRCL
jgi:hypothetical protein